MRREFRAAETPIERGVTLIEASAGTGKTYTIAALFLRLIVEEGLTVGQILVTTYTKPATAELRTRIRLRLSEAREAWTLGGAKDPLLQALLDHRRVEPELALKRIEAALRAFDEAAIHTIHSFCERVLRDRAFETRQPFDAELITDQSALLREIAEDYWRTHLYGADPAMFAAALSAKLSPPTLAMRLLRTTAHHTLHILPAPTERARLSAEIAALTARFRQGWESWRAAVRTLFLVANDWAKGESKKPELISERLALLDLCATDPTAPIAAYAALDQFSLGKIQADTRAKHPPPSHPFFELCAEIAAAREKFGPAVEAEFLAWGRAELRRRKMQRNVVSFDDLLERLARVLAAIDGTRLATLVRTRFRAALIDEFQDTDPVQEAIFRTIFAGDENWLYLIGDPKQAIYGFRGADVFSYLAAAGRANRTYRLGTNQRSTQPLVEAVNTIFTRSAAPFVVPEIAFETVAAAGRAEAGPLRFDGKARAPFRFWLGDGDEPLIATAFEKTLPRIVAAEMARLLNGSGSLAGASLAPPNLAVLTMKNKQARDMQTALAALGIPSVLLSNASVFQSREAAEMRTLLSAIAEPARHGLLRTALGTRLLALSAPAIDALTTDERGWESWLVRFQRWNEIWRTSGFIQMIRTLLRECDARPRILAQTEGERMLTNIQHLSEVLHQAATEQRFVPSALTQWLTDRMRDPAPASEEHELRLERDAEAVKVVTIHKSKGLEYDVVFCPFAWGKADLQKNERPCFHEQDAAKTLTLDLGSENLVAHERAAVLEKLQEQTRLLYVALTRARHECHFVWGAIAKNESSAAMWLLHPPKPPLEDALTVLAIHATTLTPPEMHAQILQLASDHPEAIAVDRLPTPETAPYRPPRTRETPLHAREFRGAIDRRWRISSFTSLTEHRDTELPDYDRAPPLGESAETGVAPSGIHAFPAGKTAGVFLHAVFEELDFTQPADLAPLVAKKLAGFGFNTAEWSEAVGKCVRQTLQVELTPGLRLEDVPISARLTELEFYFPVEHLESGALSILLREAGVERLSFDSRRGLLKGFIDLVFERGGKFFVVDWKSNRLGTDASAYREPALRAAMAQHNYGLQSHLYVLALHRYLRLRLGADYDYDQHFGGVFYIFARGVDPAKPDHGVFRDLPPRTRIERLDALFSSKP
jgi:exodeoxyribonuclease V beta subunit